MKPKIILVLLLSLSIRANSQILKPIKWAYAAKRSSTTEAILYIKADIAAGWHIYSVNQKDGGPERTKFSFTLTQEFSLIGKIQEPKPIKKYEEAFDMDVLYFEKSAVFTQKIKLNKSATVVKGKVSFMACTNEQCLPPYEVEFSIPVS